MLKWFVNLKISRKLYTGFLLMTILGLIIGIVGIVNLLSLAKNEQELYNLNTVSAISIGNVIEDFLLIRINVRDLVIHANEDKTKFYENIDACLVDVNKQLDSYATTFIDQQDIDNFNKGKADYSEYTAQLGKLVDASKAGKSSTEMLKEIEAITPIANKTMDDLKVVAAYNSSSASAKIDKDDIASKSIVFIMIGIIAVSILLAVLLSNYISKLIGKPLMTISNDAEKLALGDVDITYSGSQRRDEIGKLEAAISKVVEGRKRQVRETQRLADGDLTVTIEIDSDKDVLGKSLSHLVNSFNDLVVSIVTSSEQVASGANLVSDSSMSLSQGATEQASSVEELTASLEEIASQTTQNAQNAQKANALAQNAKLDAETGNSQMKDMLRAMEDINASSSSINKIIKVIDDIAFQTNILALNAAVEAARAGQHGKGFAVVAEEVRTLAARSAQAAKETTDLIEGSIRKVEAGTKIANTTADALGKIVVEVADAAELVESIAEASNAQALAIEQVNNGILQVSQVVQSNAATSEESVAASEELSSQANQLKDMVSTFKTKHQDVIGMTSEKGHGQIGGRAKPIMNKQVQVKSHISLGDDFGKY